MRKLIIIIILCSGCYISDSTRQEEYVKYHPSTKLHIKELILASKVTVGMTRSEVIASWGNPKSSSKTISARGPRLTTLRYSGTIIYLKDNVVTTMHRY